MQLFPQTPQLRHHAHTHRDAETFWALLYSVYELFFPRTCASCLSYGQCMGLGRALCTRCDYLVRYSLVKVMRPKSRYALPPVFSAGAYTHELARCILAFKNGGRTDLTEYFVTGLVRAAYEILGPLSSSPTKAMGMRNKTSSQQIYWVPIPSTAQSARRRGFVPAELLAQQTLRQLRKTPLTETFEFQLGRFLRQKSRLSSATGQKLLGVSARRRRILDSMSIRPTLTSVLGRERDLRGKKCVLVDDVVTTGATLKAATSILEKHGAHVIGAITVAAVPRKTSEETKRHNVESNLTQR